MLKRWVEIRTEESAWLVDMEFLLSSYQCTWGTECNGINPERPDLGCCANGAYLEKEDIELLKKRVPELTAEVWENKREKYIDTVRTRNKLGITTKKDKKTSIVDPKNSVSGCVFANSADFAGGAGCALHISALSRGESPFDWKPSICWQMPLLVDYSEETDLHILRMFHWSQEEYPWFCSQDEISWVAEKPLYQTMNEELKRLCDSYDKTIFPKLMLICDTAWKQAKLKKPEKKRIPVTVQVL